MRWRVRDEERRGEGEGEVLDQPTGMKRGWWTRHLTLSAGDGRVEPRVGTAMRLEHVEKDGARLRGSVERSQHIETDDVSGALPDAIEGCLSKEECHTVVFDVPGASKALHGFADQRHTSLVGPVLRDGHAEARKELLLG